MEVIWIKKGDGVLRDGITKYSLPGNTICCLVPGQLKGLKIRPETEGHYLSFPSDFLPLQEPFSNYHRAMMFATDEENSGITELLIGKIEHEIKNRFLLRVEMVKDYLKILLIYLARKCTFIQAVSVNARDRETTEKFLRMVGLNYKQMKMVGDYASSLHVTPNYLNRIVKDVSGFPASHHIQQCVIAEAKRQAANPTITMKEVAADLGFENSGHFSKFFKNNAGKNFTCFRKDFI